MSFPCRKLGGGKGRKACFHALEGGKGGGVRSQRKNRLFTLHINYINIGFSCFMQGACSNFARVPNGLMLDIRPLKSLGTKTNIMERWSDNQTRCF